jgi:hypothetical protein
MRVQFTRRADGSGLLRCIRDDGSVTWQKNDRHAAFFALHDLTHFAVETVLGYRRGFFGLINEGWDIDDTTGKGARGALPAEAVEVEHIVGMLAAEQASRVLLTDDEFNEQLSGTGVARRMKDGEIAQVRKRRSELFTQWDNVAAGETLELRFPA